MTSKGEPVFASEKLPKGMETTWQIADNKSSTVYRKAQIKKTYSP